MQTIRLRVAENGGSVPMTPEQVRIIEAVSPTADVERVEGGLRITIHDLHGAHSAELGDGDDYVLTAEDKSEIADMAAELVSVPVQDVQVNGTSVVSGGVANVPLATANRHGVIRVSTGLGINSSGNLYVVLATSEQAKAGTFPYASITPSVQHTSTFYGLAKAAGDATQSASSNAVGTYTDAAKVAIQKMLGIYEPPWELLNEITMESEGRIDLTADDNGTPYNLISAYVDIYYPANTPNASTGYDRYYFVDGDGVKLTAETSRYQTNTANQTKFINVMRQGGLAMAVYSRANVTGGAMTLLMKYTGVKFGYGNIVRIYMDTNDVEPTGTIIKIYGQRAY
jgi:hypothetical protein